MSRSKGQRKKKASKANSRKTSDDTQGLSFTGTLKAMNKLLKAYHHEGYLSNLGPGQLPPAIEDERKKLTRLWKPASITSSFRDKVETFGKQYFDSMIKSLIEHHQGIVESLKTELETKCSLNLTDFEAAQKKAISWAKKSLGKRLKNNSISKFETCMMEVKSCINPSTIAGADSLSDSTGLAPSEESSQEPLSTNQPPSGEADQTPDLSGGVPQSPHTPLINNRKRKQQSSPTISDTGSPLATRQRTEMQGDDDENISNPQIDNISETISTEGSSDSDKQTSSKSPKQTDSRSYSRVTASVSTPKRKRDEDSTSSGSSPVNKESRMKSPPIQKTKKRPTSISVWNARDEGLDNSWVLPDLTSSTVFFGDSNNSRISKSSNRNIQIVSFPGGNFGKVSGFLKHQVKGKTYHCVKKLILNFGINDRETKTSLMKTKLSELISLLQISFPSATICIADLQWSPRLPKSEISALNLISVELKRLEDQKKIQVIPRLSDDKFSIHSNDKFGIHWTKECANNMLEHWLDHLN